MRTRLFILLLVAQSYVSYAKDYTVYYRQTQLAEEYLLNGKLTLALVHYDSAFHGYDFKFARDCIIAAQVAAYLNKDLQTFRYMTYCMEAGISYDCIREWKIFDRFLQTNNGRELERVHQLFRNRYLYRIDTILNKEMTRRHDEEQSVKGSDTAVYFDVLDDNIRRIEELINEGRPPFEKIAGLQNTIIQSQSQVVSRSKCCYATQMATPTLLHYDYAFEVLGKRLTTAMLKGYINPREVVACYIFSRYQRGRPSRKYNRVPPSRELSFDEPEYSSMVFNLSFEKARVDTATANHYRHQWFIPRTGTALSPVTLWELYGINIMVGEWKY